MNLQSFLESSTGEVAAWVSNLAARAVATVISLNPKAEELDREMEELRAISNDVSEEIRTGELENKRPTHQTQTWLSLVGKIEARVDKFRLSLQQRGASSEGSSLRSSYQLACEAAECLKEVQRLKTQKSDLLPLLIQAPPPAVVELPSSSLYDNVGAEETLSEIRSLVEGDEAPVIGIYGMGGIGKTTLLKAINNEFLHRGSSQFDLVIWVTVSKELDVHKVQEEIAVRLGYSRPGKGQGKTLTEHPTDRVNTLRRALSQRKFLLLLDDLWEKLDLGAVGVPFSSSSDRNGSKIVFTTRLVEVCNRMDAEWKVQVPLLDQARSWELFCQKLGRGEDQWDPSVRSQAEDVCKKCGGLPITLITVGRAMAGATTLGEWKDALKDLEGIPPGLGDMEKKVLESLKFSFDRLEDKSARECLLYFRPLPRG
ncbi:unnamed protein product [Spirodela intermedia]|uniref:NB-ARC domain-containing protein n=1 Tax=Spirodela intermedia TaxID=51605 RepID=A0A7I8LI39_SPIIN|nr:unnamed protein product [Spirodela intermedia]